MNVLWVFVSTVKERLKGVVETFYFHPEELQVPFKLKIRPSANAEQPSSFNLERSPSSPPGSEHCGKKKTCRPVSAVSSSTVTMSFRLVAEVLLLVEHHARMTRQSDVRASSLLACE